MFWIQCIGDTSISTLDVVRPFNCIQNMRDGSVNHHLRRKCFYRINSLIVKFLNNRINLVILCIYLYFLSNVQSLKPFVDCKIHAVSVTLTTIKI